MRILSAVDKKIAIGLIGYESKREIPRCLDPWVGHIDTMILGDGKFDHYDGQNDYSQDGWLEFAEKRYGDKCEVVTYKHAGRQVDKRQKYLDIAGELNCDFLIAVDTDEYIHPQYQDWQKFYKQLYHLSEAIEDRMFYQWVWIPDEKLWPKQGNKFPSNYWGRSAKIHKDPGTMRFCSHSHFAWCSKDVTDEQLYKWQIENTRNVDNDMVQQIENPYIFQARNTLEGVRVTMDRTLRTKEQIQKGEDWAIRNWHEESAQQHYTYMKLIKSPPPFKNGFEGERWSSWDEFAKAPHTFNKETGQRENL